MCLCFRIFCSLLNRKTAKEAVAVWLKGCIPCIAALYGGKLLTVLFVKCFGTVGEFMGIAVGGILLGLSFYLLSCAVNGGIKGKVGRKLLLTAVCILLAIVLRIFCRIFSDRVLNRLLHKNGCGV